MPNPDISFKDIDTCPTGTGVYQIYFIEGSKKVWLKVGISANLRKRLKQHRSSRQSGLKTKGTKQTVSKEFSGGPNEVCSKGSILAKHLFFDVELETRLAKNFKSEKIRSEFIRNECYVVIQVTDSEEQAKVIEDELELSGRFRYVGRVQQRINSVFRCGARGKFMQLECPMLWSNLKPTELDEVRRCESCDRNVFLCHTADEFVELARKKECVAIPTNLSVTSGDIQQPHVMGVPAPWSYNLSAKAIRWWREVYSSAPELSRQFGYEMSATQIVAQKKARGGEQ